MSGTLALLPCTPYDVHRVSFTGYAAVYSRGLVVGGKIILKCIFAEDFDHVV
jgi:hypothetical protein